MHGFVLGPLQFQSTGQTQFRPQEQHIGKKSFPTEPMKTEPSFRSSTHSPTESQLCFFSAHL